jgi:hypothetical protein
VRRHLVAQRVQARRIAVFLDGQLVAVAELVFLAEQPRLQEVEQRPQLGQVVLDRRPGEAQPVARRQRARPDGPGCAGS